MSPPVPTKPHTSFSLTSEQRDALTSIFAGYHGNMAKVFRAVTDAIIVLGKEDRLGLMLAATASTAGRVTFKLSIEWNLQPCGETCGEISIEEFIANASRAGLITAEPPPKSEDMG